MEVKKSNSSVSLKFNFSDFKNYLMQKESNVEDEKVKEFLMVAEEYFSDRKYEILNDIYFDFIGRDK